MLSLENLTLRRGGRALFTGLGFSLMPGSLCVLRGANGTGKSSLLKTIAGILKAEEGAILWQGVPIAESPDFLHQMLYIGHQNAVKRNLTVIENLAFWADLYDTAMLIPAALHCFRLEEVAEMPCGKLSAGWQRRVALARLVAVPSTLWLLDEPTTHLDEEGATLLNNLITTRCNQGGIVVMACHGEVGVKPASLMHLEDFT